MVSSRIPRTWPGVLTGCTLAGSCALVVGSSGCSVLTLDGLQGGGGTGAATGGGQGGDGPASTASSSTSTQASTAGPGTSVGTGGGAGGSGGAGGEGGGGGSCPDVCAAHPGAVLCDGFDTSGDLDAWQVATEETENPVFSVVQDPVFSCPSAAKIEFGGVAAAEGGWAQLGRTLPGSPTHTTATARVLREPTDDAPEGVFEVLWRTGNKSCFVQLYVGEDPRRAEVYADQYDDVGAGVNLGSGDFALTGGTTKGVWLEIGIELQLGATPAVVVTVDGDSETIELDAAGAADCDAAADPDTIEVRLGPPYNDAPTTLHYDDVVALAE